MPTSLRTGLVSITFRNRTAEQVIADVATAGLEGIEWGGDVHVPPGNLPIATAVRRQTIDAGLVVTAYGSYYNSTKDPAELAEKVLATAAELGAPTVRIWAGPVGSRQADDATRTQIADDVARVCDLAKPLGLTVTLEYHGNTLTDTLESTLRLLQAVDRPNLYSGWQPRDGHDGPTGAAEIALLGTKLGNVHVFQWQNYNNRFPLAEGAERWRTYLGAAATDGRPRFALLEFVKDDSVEQFLNDAATLKTLVQSSLRVPTGE